MTTTEPPPIAPEPPPKPRRRRGWSLSVRGLMLLVLVVGGSIGWEMNRLTRIKRAVAVLVRNPGDPLGGPAPGQANTFVIGGPPDRTVIGYGPEEFTWLPGWFRSAVGVDHFRKVTLVRPRRRPTPADWSAIATLGSVQALDFSDLKLQDDDLAGLTACPNLLGLSLFDTGITDRGLIPVGSLANLRGLDLRLTKVSPAGLAPLAELVELRTLELGNGAGTDAGLAHLRGLTELRTLAAGGFGGAVSDVGLGYLQGMTHLETLEFDARRVTDRGLATLVGLPHLKSLVIKPAFPKVAEAILLSAAGVSQFAGLTHLETLQLEPLAVMDDTWLEAIGRLVKLSDLQVGGERITDAGLAHLKGLTRLTRLRIASPEVTDVGLLHLYPLGKLTELGLYARVSDAGVAAIRTALPGLTRVHNTRWPDPTEDAVLLKPPTMPPPPLPPVQIRLTPPP